MKKKIILLFAIITLSNCSDNDSIFFLDNVIIGEWQLVQERVIGFNGPIILDYSDQNIIYHFKSNGNLIITGGDNPRNSNYTFEYGYYSSQPSSQDQKLFFVTFDGFDFKWLFSLENDIMIIASSHVDGSDLVFEKR